MIYIDSKNQLHDDADGFALTLASWPADARPATDAEIESVRNPSKSAAELAEIAAIEARQYLSSTDWYAIRLSETGIAIPADILLARQAARSSIK